MSLVHCFYSISPVCFHCDLSRVRERLAIQPITPVVYHRHKRGALHSLLSLCVYKKAAFQPSFPNNLSPVLSLEQVKSPTSLVKSSLECSSQMEDFFDEYDFYNFEQDRIANLGHSGKQRSKRDVIFNTNRPDPSNGHTRKLLIKYRNTEIKRRRGKL